MSLIKTPPSGRKPIKVHVGEWDEDVVSAAIRLELAREGQVYYVSNRVKTIDGKPSIQIYLPARTAVVLKEGKVQQPRAKKAAEPVKA